MRLFAVTAAAIALSAANFPPSPRSVAGIPIDQLRASDPRPRFDEYEAENATTDGDITGPDRRHGTLAAEASGRRAVLLQRRSQSVGIALAHSADGLTIRYSVPDSPNGRGLSGTLSVLVDGVEAATANVTSRYGWFYGRYPFTNRPSDGTPHHFWDEVRIRLPHLVNGGSRITVRQAQSSQLPWIAIDLIDATQIPSPIPPPAEALSVSDFGADKGGVRSSKAAFRNAIRAAARSGRPLYVPSGLYRVEGHLELDRVRIIGAGAWHSILFGHGVGLYGRRTGVGSTAVAISGLAIEGDVDERVDSRPLAAIGGRFSRSSFSDLYLHHTKVGLWLDGPGSDISIVRSQIADQTADGINLHRGFVDGLIADNFIRNTGDDGIALWSEGAADSRIVVRGNIVASPLLANGIATYGGHDIAIIQNIVADTVTEGGGVHLGTRFKSVPFSGSIQISQNLIARSGSFDPHWGFGVGAIWLYALEQPIERASITIKDLRVEDSSCEAIQLVGPHGIDGVMFDDVQVRRPGGAMLAANTQGSVTMKSVVLAGERGQSSVASVQPQLQIVDAGGNLGWRTSPDAPPHPPTCVLNR